MSTTNDEEIARLSVEISFYKKAYKELQDSWYGGAGPSVRFRDRKMEALHNMIDRHNMAIEVMILEEKSDEVNEGVLADGCADALPIPDRWPPSRGGAR